MEIKGRIGRGIGKEKTHENSGYRITGAHGLAQVLYTPGNWARDFAPTQNILMTMHPSLTDPS